MENVVVVAVTTRAATIAEARGVAEAIDAVRATALVTTAVTA